MRYVSLDNMQLTFIQHPLILNGYIQYMSLYILAYGYEVLYTNTYTLGGHKSLGTTKNDMDPKHIEKTEILWLVLLYRVFWDFYFNQLLESHLVNFW